MLISKPHYLIIKQKWYYSPGEKIIRKKKFVKIKTELRKKIKEQTVEKVKCSKGRSTHEMSGKVIITCFKNQEHKNTKLHV